jgi:GntR family transcriptional regulator/MocR family aminotransferase
MGNTLTEDAAAELIENGELRRHARKVRYVYARRRDTFAASLDRHLKAYVDYEIPDGGLAYWLRFKSDDVLDKLECHAEEVGLRFAASRSFMTRDGAPRGLRFGFASMTELEADEALSRVRRAIA